MVPGWAADDGAALLFEGTRFVRAVASRPGARAWRVERVGGRVTEAVAVPEFLG